MSETKNAQDDDTIQKTENDIDTASPNEALTRREREVLELLTRGLSIKLIAESLQISQHTVESHVSSIYTKIVAPSRTKPVIARVNIHKPEDVTDERVLDEAIRKLMTSHKNAVMAT